MDDNPDIRRVVLAQIKSLGYRVSEADSGDAALAVLEADAATFDLVMTDLVMPGQTGGLDLARLVRLRWPTLGILLTSGFSGEFARGEGEDKASFEMLRKPYRKKELACTLQRLMSEAGSTETC